MAFGNNVFINCPFDEEFYILLRPLLFTVYYLKLTPRIAFERLDSAEARIQKIVELIQDSRYSIHDLSRLRTKKPGDFSRLNMPFELGVDMGCRLFKGGRWSRKKCLILGAEQYGYQAALSDLSGSDVAIHGNEPAEIVVAVRNWLNHEAKLNASGPARIWGSFTDFMADDYDERISRGFSPSDIERLPVGELMRAMKTWTQRRI